jgi:aryl-alcohol dehydrogenase-like predicted oxidoreductase
VAKEIGCSTAQVALNWIRQQTILTQKNKIIPIIGSRKESQVKDSLACLEFVLSDDQMQRLNEISKIELGFPHDFLNSEMIKDIIYGGTYSSMVLKK